MRQVQNCYGDKHQYGAIERTHINMRCGERILTDQRHQERLPEEVTAEQRDEVGIQFNEVRRTGQSVLSRGAAGTKPCGRKEHGAASGPGGVTVIGAERLQTTSFEGFSDK